MKLITLLEKAVLQEGKDEGLMITPHMRRDTEKLRKFFDEEGYHAEWESRYGYFFVPEDEENYDELEKELEKEFRRKKINARFEGVF